MAVKISATRENALAEVEIAAGKVVAAGKSYKSSADQMRKAARSYGLVSRNLERFATSFMGKIEKIANKEMSNSEAKLSLQSLKICGTSSAQEEK